MCSTSTMLSPRPWTPLFPSSQGNNGDVFFNDDKLSPVNKTGLQIKEDVFLPRASMSSIGSESGEQHQSSFLLDCSNPRYKTEICRNFKERATCVYGDQCQFAHGRRELRDVVRNCKYKTKHCQKYWVTGYCAYGPRCNFLHNEEAEEDNPAPVKRRSIRSVIGRASSRCSSTSSGSVTPEPPLENEVKKVNSDSDDDIFSGMEKWDNKEP